MSKPALEKTSRLALYLIFVVGLAGCSKKETPTTTSGQGANPPAASEAATPAPAQQSAAANPSPPVVQPNAEPDLAELNRNLLRWMMRNQRRPNNFEDFAATAGVTIPPPPAGKKYIIGKDMHIQLVSK